MSKDGSLKLLGVLVSLVLGFFIIISSVFILYSNEVGVSENATNLEKRIFYKKAYLGDYLKQVSDYKKTILIKNENGELLTKWIIRLFGILWLGFGLSLFLTPIFSKVAKNRFIPKIFLFSFLFVIFFIIFLKVYNFYLEGGFDFGLASLIFGNKNDLYGTELSLGNKFFIILVIILIFALIGWIYYYKNEKKEESEN